ncbi:MAG TPA: hypothetical protein VG476_07995 [Acidimicrobiales bacterium]|nr:hypothetical protein [Acidimicrobiales bacterium]
MTTTTSSPSGRPPGRTARPAGDGEPEAVDMEPNDPEASVDPASDAARKQARLADSMARLRRRTKLVATERWLLVAGSVMAPLGGFLVILGWFGASHTGHLFEQIPYMISGGLFGLVLVIAGGFCYFGYWLARLVSEEGQQNTRLLETLERIEGHLANGSSAPNGRPGNEPQTPSARRGGARPPLSSTRPEFVATLTGTLYHRPDCMVVADRSAEDLRSVRAGAKGRSPCRMCLPPDEEAAGAQGRPEEMPDPASRD